MPLRDILHRKEDSNNNNRLSVDDFRFVRTDTHTEEPINLPDFIDDPKSSIPHSHEGRKSIFRRLSRSSDAPSSPPSREKDRSERRLSHLLHHDRSSSRRSNNSSTSFNLPSDLPAIESNNVDEQEREAQWEKRATTLIQNNPRLATSSSSLDKPGSSRPGSSFDIPRGSEGNRSRSPSISNPQEDVNIQEAIRLHEAGDLERSTDMFGILADPNSTNNALAQVLYGLALRHGWGCHPNPSKAITYLSLAASNSALIESEALQAGMKKGGAAKGELVLAMFELGNCYRNGWGVEKDPVAARTYYETAANLGDTDAMNETGWCYLEGFGGKKDKFTAAKYYRLAEEHGSKTLGNSWIWKEKYNPK